MASLTSNISDELTKPLLSTLTDNDGDGIPADARVTEGNVVRVTEGGVIRIID